MFVICTIAAVNAQIRPIPPYIGGATGEANAVILKQEYDLNPDGSYIYRSVQDYIIFFIYFIK